MKRIILLGILLNSILVFSQDLSHGYYNYRMSLYNLNPAFAGEDSSTVANFNYNSSLAGYDDRPRNSLAGVMGRLSDKIGLGGKFMSDTRGQFSVSRFDGLFSYKLKLDDQKYIRFGLSAGFVRRNFNIAGLRSAELLDQNDPTLGGSEMQTNVIFGTGVLANINGITVALSAPQIFESGGTDENTGVNSSAYITALAYYRYEVEQLKIFVTPTFIYQNIPGLDNQIDLYAKADYQDKVWVQAGYQTSNIITFGGGVALGPIRIGFLHGVSSGQLNNASASLNEIMVQIKFSDLKN